MGRAGRVAQLRCLTPRDLRRPKHWSNVGMRNLRRPVTPRSLLPSRGFLIKSLMRVLLLCIPPRRQVLIYGWPDSEGNAVSLLRFLAREGKERHIVWLASGTPGSNAQYASWIGRVTIRHKRTLGGFWAYLRSDVVCFTHGLYSSPAPCRARVFVNLWHGDGPKRTENPEFAVRPGATAVVGQTRLWGEKKAAEFGMPATSVLVVGNPRIDDLVEPMTEAQRQALHERLGSRFLLWMPTYRDSNGAGFREWSDGRRLSDTGQLASLGSHARAAADLHGVTIVVKPHPMDRDTYVGIPGLRTIDDEALNEIGISLYQMLGASSGLITDYSSVWTDYLVVDRPVLLFCPDYEEYAATRGLNVPDLQAVAPGPLVTHIEELGDFLSDVAAGRDPYRARRRALADQIGGVTEPGASRRLWQGGGGGPRARAAPAARPPRPGPRASGPL